MLSWEGVVTTRSRLHLRELFELFTEKVGCEGPWVVLLDTDVGVVP